MKKVLLVGLFCFLPVFAVTQKTKSVPAPDGGCYSVDGATQVWGFCQSTSPSSYATMKTVTPLAADDVERASENDPRMGQVLRDLQMFTEDHPFPKDAKMIIHETPGVGKVTLTANRITVNLEEGDKGTYIIYRVPLIKPGP